MKIENEDQFIAACKSHGEEIKPILDYMKEVIKEQVMNPKLTGIQTQILKHKHSFMDELKQTIDNAAMNSSKVEFNYKDTF